MKRPWSLREAAGDAGARDVAARIWAQGGRIVSDGRDVLRRQVEPAGPPEAREARAAARRDGRRDGRRDARRDDGGREASMVPRAEFTSYYGRPVLKPTVWKEDIAYYFFLGGLSAGCSLLGAGADQTDRPGLRRGTRIAALGSLAAGSYYLIHDLGRPERFHHMLRVAKPTSPMSVGTWILAAYGPPTGLAAISELLPGRVRSTVLGRLVDAFARPAGLAAAGLAPAVASYTAVLLSQTAVPAWHEAHEELPFIFTASAAASAGGLGMIVAPVQEAAPARRLAMFGAIVELAASRRLESRLGLVGEVFVTGDAHRELSRASTLTAAGVLGSMLLGRRSRTVAVLSGAALLAGGLYERLGLLHAGMASARDPKYTVVPQRERLERGERDDGGATEPT